MTPDFQIPFDTVNSASLVITSRRAVDSNDTVSIDLKNLGVLNATGNSPVTTTFDLETLGVFSLGWASGRPLDLSLAYNQGTRDNESLTMVSSVFNLDYINGVAPVPIPPSALLFASGLIGFVAVRRRFKK
jgi:hypothetical protein